MTHFPVPNVTDTEDIFSVFRFVNNEASAGIFFPIILLSIWFIALIGSFAEGRQAVKAWIFASFISSILAIMLAIMGFLENKWMYLLILFVAFGLFWMRLQNAKD